MTVPKKVEDRIKDGLKRYLKILESQKNRDVSEADTATLVKDILADVFGYDKYLEITGEYNIRSTFCDLAVKIDSKLRFLIEVKAIGIELKDNHVRQAIDYAANQGCDWVILTNGVKWVVYHVLFHKPIDKHELATLDLLNMNLRDESCIEQLYLLTREGINKGALAEYRDRQEAMSRYVIAAIMLNCPTVNNAIRKEIRRLSGLKIDAEELEKTMREEVLKREAIEGDQAQSANRRIARAADKTIRKTKVITPEVSCPPTLEKPSGI